LVKVASSPNLDTCPVNGLQLMDINESPVYVLLNPAINHAQKDLPITIFESGGSSKLIGPVQALYVCMISGLEIVHTV
jgi:hypothetical protein